MTPTKRGTDWQYMANEAKAGRLRLDPDVAQGFSNACDRLIDHLMEARDMIQNAGFIDRLGDFDCADQLAPMLRKLAIEPGRPGMTVNSMTAALDDFIAVARLMKETVSYSLRRTMAQDTHNAHRIATAG